MLLTEVMQNIVLDIINSYDLGRSLMTTQDNWL